jgi:hypothetical protein
VIERGGNTMRRGLWLFGAFLVVWCGWGYVALDAFGSSDGRVFEQVSPVFKGGYGATRVEGVAGDGNTIMFYSAGAFNGAPAGPQLTADYVSHRGTLEWSTLPIMTPAALLPDVDGTDISPSLDSVVSVGKPGLNLQQATQLGSEEQFLLHSTALPDTEATWQPAGAPLMTLSLAPSRFAYIGASSDFCHLFFLENEAQPLLAEAESLEFGKGGTYEFNRGCDGTPATLKLVGVKNKFGPHDEPEVINRACGVDIGIKNYGTEGNQFNSIADDGNEIFFTTCIPPSNSAPYQLFMRLGGTKSVEVSRPLTSTCEEVPCPGAGARASAEFAGASEDGSRVFFTAPLAAGQEPLVSGDADASRNLYMANIGCPLIKTDCSAAERVMLSLSEVSHDTNGGEAAEVQRVMRSAPDGSRVYFVARGKLSGLPNAEGSLPRSGADNLYLYDVNSGTTTFIADLCSGREASGTAEDTLCPSAEVADNTRESQTAGIDGRFLVFTTYARLTDDDTDAAKDVYRYDAVRGTLERISIGEGGADVNGNGEENSNGERFDATIAQGHLEPTVQDQHELNTRAINEDGSRIIFDSSEPLSPAATNGLANVYEWHEGSNGEGSVSLVSGGSALEPVGNLNPAVISAQGGDVVFSTTQSLVSLDTDEAPDIYDARINGGFPLSPAAVSPCSGDGCQGPLTNPASLLVPGSVTQTAGENLPKPKLAVKPKKKQPKKKKQKKRAKPKKHSKVGRKAKRASRSSVASGGFTSSGGRGQ